MAIRVTGERTPERNSLEAPRWLLLLIAALFAMVVGLVAGILTAVSGSATVQAVTVGFLVFGGGLSVILTAIDFLAERDR